MSIRNGNPRTSAAVDGARRAFLLDATMGLGATAFAQLLGPAVQAAAVNELGTLVTGHVRPRAKRVIFMHMMGALSQVDSFDYKPELERRHGQELPPSVRESQRISAMSASQASFPLIRPLRPFHQQGESGAWVSELFPHIGQVADELCFVKTMHTEHVNHTPAAKFIHTGFQFSGRPSIGAWVNYALGSDNSDLPAFVVLPSQGTTAAQNVEPVTFGSAFLASRHQGVQFGSGEQPVLYIGSPDGIDSNNRRETLDFIDRLARHQYERSLDEEIESKIAQYEMSYRMQRSVPEVADLTGEPEHILRMYGPAVQQPGSFARNCLIARRLAERSVKYIYMIQTGWDHHNGIAESHPRDCEFVDQPAAALILDLKQRGLLDDTLVVFGSEFGRTSFAQGAINGNFGRDHHGGAFTYWLAGGGVKAGYTHGETDDFCYNIARDPVHVHDLQATILHLLGIDHERLTFRYQGRDFRLTDVHGQVVEQILA